MRPHHTTPVAAACPVGGPAEHGSMPQDTGCLVREAGAALGSPAAPQGTTDPACLGGHPRHAGFTPATPGISGPRCQTQWQEATCPGFLGSGQAVPGHVLTGPLGRDGVGRSGRSRRHMGREMRLAGRNEPGWDGSGCWSGTWSVGHSRWCRRDEICKPRGHSARVSSGIGGAWTGACGRLWPWGQWRRRGPGHWEAAGVGWDGGGMAQGAPPEWPRGPGAGVEPGSGTSRPARGQTHATVPGPPPTRTALPVLSLTRWESSSWCPEVK